METAPGGNVGSGCPPAINGNVYLSLGFCENSMPWKPHSH